MVSKLISFYFRESHIMLKAWFLDSFLDTILDAFWTLFEQFLDSSYAVPNSENSGKSFLVIKPKHISIRLWTESRIEKDI